MGDAREGVDPRPAAALSRPATLRITVLGQVELTVAGRAVRLAGQRQWALVALLAIEKGRPVSVDRLLDVLWDGRPPATARTKLQAHVSGLRHAMGRQEARQPGEDAYLKTYPHGYALRSDGVQLDLDEFDHLMAQAAAAKETGEYCRASDLYGGALARWSGPALSGLEMRHLQDIAAVLEERRLLGVEAKAEADMVTGRSDLVVAELSGWVATHPFRDRLRLLLMLALHRCGCRAEALNVYRKGREASVRELGLEPGAELREMHQRILADDPALRAGSCVQRLTRASGLAPST